MKPSIDQVMADSGTSLNMIPDADFNKIYDHFFKGKLNCYKSPTTLTICECTEEQHKSIPDLEFHIDNVPYTINRDQWFEKSGNKCVIKFMHGVRSHHWILGLNFFTNYYTVFDYEHKRLGFAQSVIAGSPPSRGFMRWVMGYEKNSTINAQSQTKKSSSEVKWANVSPVLKIQFILVSVVVVTYLCYDKYIKSSEKKAQQVS